VAGLTRKGKEVGGKREKRKDNAATCGFREKS
jgi:hypothetical protein